MDNLTPDLRDLVVADALSLEDALVIMAEQFAGLAVDVSPVAFSAEEAAAASDVARDGIGAGAGAGPAELARSGARVVTPYLRGASIVDMSTDVHNPPTQFNFPQWCEARDRLRALGANAPQGSALSNLWRTAQAMNVAQENYGNAMSVVAHQCGRLFTERAVWALLGTPPESASDNLNGRIGQLSMKRGNWPEYVRVAPTKQQLRGLCVHLHALRGFGNRVDHESLPDVRPEEKPEIVHRVYAVAQFLVESAAHEDQGPAQGLARASDPQENNAGPVTPAHREEAPAHLILTWELAYLDDFSLREVELMLQERNLATTGDRAQKHELLRCYGHATRHM